MIFPGKPNTVEQDGARILRNQLGFREVFAYLRRMSTEIDTAAIYTSGSNLDVIRGRAQMLRAVLELLEAKEK
jgi:hypothetical protein